MSGLWLTADKLRSALREILGAQWGGKELRAGTSRRRWDAWYRTDARICVVEYDGNRHYQDPESVRADDEKDAIAQNFGYRVCRMPYWLQLDTQTLKHVFGLDATYNTAYPHGFIDTKHFPASYCELGLTRFRRELDTLPASLRAQVVRSLQEKARTRGANYVLPASLVGILSERVHTDA